MSEKVQAQVVFLLEHEIVAASKAVRRFHSLHKDEAASQEDRDVAMAEMVNTCSAALWHASDDKPLILTSARTLYGPAVKEDQ